MRPVRSLLREITADVGQIFNLPLSFKISPSLDEFPTESPAKPQRREGRRDTGRMQTLRSSRLCGLAVLTWLQLCHTVRYLRFAIGWTGKHNSARWAFDAPAEC